MTLPAGAAGKYNAAAARHSTILYTKYYQYKTEKIRYISMNSIKKCVYNKYREPVIIAHSAIKPYGAVN